jgi:methyl coenzyme M reductase gamma subunit
MPLNSETAIAEVALRKLQVIQAGQAASAEDADIVVEKIQGMLEDLSRREIHYADSIEEVSAAAYDHLATCLAVRCMDEFGITGNQRAEMRAARMEAEMTLRTLARYIARPNDLKLQAPMGRRRSW